MPTLVKGLAGEIAVAVKLLLDEDRGMRTASALYLLATKLFSFAPSNNIINASYNPPTIEIRNHGRP
jgi:hypothetical protein